MQTMDARVSSREERAAESRARRAAEAAQAQVNPLPVTLEGRQAARRQRLAQMPEVRAQREAAKAARPRPLRQRIAVLEAQTERLAAKKS